MSFETKLLKKFDKCFKHYKQYPDIVILGKNQWHEMETDPNFKDYYGIDGNWIIRSRPLFFASHMNDLFLCIPKRILP